MAVVYYDDEQRQQTPQQQTPGGMARQAPNWATGQTADWWQNLYNSTGQNLEQTNASLESQANAFRSQYGSAAPADDASIFQMLASGQTPQMPKNATPSQQWNSPGGDALLQQLLQRAQQGLNITASDPRIRQQVDPAVAQMERQSRTYLDDVAERSGPLANLQGERRLAAERTGQAAGRLESEVLAREVGATRDEIAQALGLLSSNRQSDLGMQLSRDLAALTSRDRSLDRNQSMEQFLRELALREYDTNNAWDYRWATL